MCIYTCNIYLTRKDIYFISEILQFKSEHDVNKQVFNEHNDAVVKKKPESIDRNQYSMGGESDGFSFNDRSDDTNPAVKNEGLAFRYYIMNV